MFNSDTIPLILNNLSLDDAKNFGLSCKKYFGIYKKYISTHPDLKFFSDFLKENQILEENILNHPEAELRSNFEIAYYEHIDSYLENRLESCPEYSTYLSKLDDIIRITRQNKDSYNSLNMPTKIKLLINIWLRYPSKRLRLVPSEVLNYYIQDTKILNIEYVAIFKLMIIPCIGSYMSRNDDIWNVRSHIIDTTEELIGFSVRDDNKFTYACYDVCGDIAPPLSLCRNCLSFPNECGKKRSKCGLCNYYYLDVEHINTDSIFRTSTISESTNIYHSGYHLGNFKETMKLLIKQNHYILDI